VSGRSGSGAEHAELVALGIGQHDPRLLALPDVDVTGSQADEAIDLVTLVLRAEIEVQAVLCPLRLGDRLEEQAGDGVGRRPDLELVGLVVHDDPAEGLSPPTAERDGVERIDDCLLPLEAHDREATRRVEGAWEVAVVGRFHDAHSC
jgi:hypothetical protein